MNKKEEEKKDEKNLKKPEPFAFKNWTELIKPKKIDVNKEEGKWMEFYMNLLLFLE